MYYNSLFQSSYYCGPIEHYEKAVVMINKIVTTLNQIQLTKETPNDDDNLDGEKSIIPTNSFEGKELPPLSSSLMSDQSSHSSKPPSKVNIPPFSLEEDLYIPKHNVYCDGKLSFLYSDFFISPPSCSKLVIGNSSELIEYFVAFQGYQLLNQLTPSLGTVKGFFYNRCGWYVVVQGSSVDTKMAVQSLYLGIVKNISFANRKRIQLPLTERQFIKLLVYVCEIGQK